MRVLVTGASGRLGRAVLPQLQTEGYDVRAMSRRPGPGIGGVRAAGRAADDQGSRPQSPEST